MLGYCGHNGDPALYDDPALWVVCRLETLGLVNTEQLPCLSRLLWIMHCNILAKVVV